MKVVILTEGGSAIGFGHLARCSALYHAFKERGVLPKFLVQGDASIARAIKGVEYRSCIWRSDKELRAYVRGADIAIIDSYLAPRSLYGYTAREAGIALYFDDFNRFSYPAGVVLNAALGAKGLAYPKKKGVAYLLGAKFTPLRKEFWKVNEKKFARTIKSILITFGGSDIGAMTPRVLALCNREFPHIKKTVIIGKGFTDIGPIARLKSANTRLIYFPPIQALVKHMRAADIAICAGGQTLCELARMGVPAIAIAVAENQRDNVNDFSRAGSALLAGWWNQARVETRISAAVRKIESVRVRKEMSAAGRSLVDGFGARRVVDILLCTQPYAKRAWREDRDTLELRAATSQDSRDLWRWRNHPLVRKWTFNSDTIPFSHHARWFRKKLADAGSKIYIGQMPVLGKIGQVRFDRGGLKTALININLNPRYMGRGLGSRLISAATRAYLAEQSEAARVKAEVLSTNAASRKAFLRAGFQFKRTALAHNTQIHEFIYTRKER